RIPPGARGLRVSFKSICSPYATEREPPMSEAPKATTEAVVKEVAQHADGIDAAALGEMLISRGYGRYSIQWAIRHALDKGDIELGPRFRLRKRAAAA